MRRKHFTYIILIFILLNGCGSGGGSSSSNSSSATVSGKVTYEDKLYGPGGFTGITSFKAVRYATIEVVDASSYVVLGSGTTDGSGNYSLTYSSSASSQVYVRVTSMTGGSAPPVEIRNLSNALYGVPSQNMAPASATVDISITITSKAAGAFNILDVYTAAGEFAKTLTGSNPPALKAYWEVGSNAGTYYAAGNGIYVANLQATDPNDSDEYDDDVLWHEYGHFMADKYSKDDSPGGVHYLNDTTQDLRLSWSEGWGNFFSSAVKNWLTANNPGILSTTNSPQLYRDTSGSGLAVAFDVSAPSAPASLPTALIYSSNELSVANILWNSMNLTSNGMSNIWDVFSNHIPTVSTPVNLEAFWDGWVARGKPSGITTYYESRQVFYKADIYEPDGAFSPLRKATIGTPEIHSLYGSGDLDFVAFDVMPADIAVSKTFTIETSDLKNGADTYLTLYGTDGVTVLSTNDNWNGASYAASCNTLTNTGCPINGTDLAQGITSAPLSSKIPFTPSISGTYYVKVNAAPDGVRPSSAGRYGTYTLLIH